MITISIATINIVNDIDFYNKLDLFCLIENDDRNALFFLKDYPDVRINLFYNEKNIIPTLNLIKELPPKLSIAVNNCKKTYAKYKETNFNNGSGLFRDFYGEYLSSPIGDQFSVIDCTLNKIIIFDKK